MIALAIPFKIMSTHCFTKQLEDLGLILDHNFHFIFITGSEGAKVLVVTGNLRSSKTQMAEVIDLKSETVSCTDFADYPLLVHGAVGGLLGKRAVICGGNSKFKDDEG